MFFVRQRFNVTKIGDLVTTFVTCYVFPNFFHSSFFLNVVIVSQILLSWSEISVSLQTGMKLGISVPFSIAQQIESMVSAILVWS